MVGNRVRSFEIGEELMNLFSLGFGATPGAADYYTGSPFSVGGGLTVGPVMPPELYGPAIRPIVEKPVFAPSDQVAAIPYVMPTYLPSATAPVTTIAVERKGVTEELKEKWSALPQGAKIAIGVSGAAIVTLLLLKLVKD